ncbi:Metal-dependent hydrolase, endonuclease/exonuclease/phosphatase family [Noviherbaspirillum humi]|uniref:Metal-dependent hydrolase, endonuclease/exonuclease/phosphatase family n=1 Tax=Noviherbaspirillum humi TaxID=1688639 RepID=A0A239CPC2_9BURK|nr:endonuclease/exonuclease/phosphatase family protein [Noviherbaspirillum humi]SNS21183.1 Metal-dependent hydrolase, endonuclease/exonuclease/phosphatase family [Noviherbaspirillum humi]
MKIRIATYNIHKGVTSFRAQPRVHALKQAISTLKADILFLQEVQGRHDLYATKHAMKWPDQPQHDFLAGEELNSVYGMNAMYDHGHHGNALLSGFPILSWRNQDVSDHAYESRGILHCVVQAPAAQIHCYVIHLGLFARSRKRQTEALVEAVTGSSPPDAPVIIAGDFNDWTNQLSDRLREGLGVKEVFDEDLSARGFGTYLRRMAGRGPQMKPARTFPAALPWLRLDRIYVRGFQVESAKVMHGGVWTKLSDHAPIVADLVLEPEMVTA